MRGIKFAMEDIVFRRVKENNLIIYDPYLLHEWDFEKNKDLDIDEITYGYGKKVWWICRKCESSFLQTPNSRTNKKSNCPYCAGQKVNHTNSLETLFPNLAEEWNYKRNGDRTPKDFTTGSKKRVWWSGKCGHEWDSSIKERTSGADCPYCYNRRVLKGYNDMWTTNPEMAKYLLDENDGYKHTQQSNKELRWKCYSCDENEKVMKVFKVYREGYYCVNCSDGFSRPEKMVFNILGQLIGSERFLTQKTFEWSNRKIYDFFLPDYNLIIEVHGEQHYKKPFYSNDENELEKIQRNDANKKEMAVKNGYDYLEVNAMSSDYHYLKSSVEKSLGRHFSLESIDWTKVQNSITSSMKMKVLELWNSESRPTPKEISEELGLERSTVSKYLQDLEKQGRCVYNSGRREKVIGVNYEKARDRWVARIQVNKTPKHLGSFKTKEEAERCRLEYDKFLENKKKGDK